MNAKTTARASKNRPSIVAYRVSVSDKDEKYKAITYNVVSLPLCIIVASKLMLWSTPNNSYIEYKNESDAEALIGLNKLITNISIGIFSLNNNLENIADNTSTNPLALNNSTNNIYAIKVTNTGFMITKTSLLPSTNQ